MTFATRPLIGGSRHVVSAGHPLAAAAAFAILEAGGNAVDAGCAAGISLGVLQPDLVSVAGVAPIMIRPAGGEVVTIDGLGVWPAGLPERHFMDARGGTIPEGVERMVVPAAIDAWLTALEMHGTMSFSDVAAAATRYAREGFPAHVLMIETIETKREAYARWPSSAAIFLPGGRPPRVGERFVQTDLANTLDRLAAAERAAGGSRLDGLSAVRHAFYRGDIARELVAFVRAEGGFLSEEDMANFRCRVEPPVAIDWMGRTLYVCGPWCQGPTLAMALRQIEENGLDGLAHNSPEYAHLLIEILNNVFADREHHFGDPRFIDVPLARLVSREHARARLAQIDPDRARGEMPGPIIGADGADLAALPREDHRPAIDTSYVAVIDRFGNAFSATPSDGSYDMPIAPGLGFAASSRGSQSRPDPDHPAGARAGKRPRLTPNAAMLVSGDDVTCLGTPGGDVQNQAVMQALLNRLHFGMSWQQALDAPRFATFNFPGSFAPFAYNPGVVNVEEGVGADTIAALKAKGHAASVWKTYEWRAGSVCVVSSDKANGLVFGAADPRRASYSIAG